MPAKKRKRPANPTVFWHVAECAAWAFTCGLTKKSAKRQELFFRAVKLDRPEGPGIAAGIKARGYG